MGIFDKVLDSVIIIAGKVFRRGASSAELAELKVQQLAAKLDTEKKQVSDLHGKLNYANRQLVTLKQARDEADAEYSRVKGSDLEKSALDAVATAEDDISRQESLIAEYQKIFDDVRIAVATSAAEIKTYENQVKKASVQELATKTFSEAAEIIRATDDLAKGSSGIGRDLEKVAEDYEKAKAGFEDAQGDEATRKLRAQKEEEHRAEIKKRLEERLSKSDK